MCICWSVTYVCGLLHRPILPCAWTSPGPTAVLVVAHAYCHFMFVSLHLSLSWSTLRLFFIGKEQTNSHTLSNSNLNEEGLLLCQYWSSTGHSKATFAYLRIEHHVKSGSTGTLSAFSFRLEPSVGVSFKLKWWFTSVNHSSGAVWESRRLSWAGRPNEPPGFRGRKELLNRASALVTACP